ncbi:MAG: alpha-methylacyl-CoA racemase [Candidatus Poriferisodalaceae bacterium]|jgi:alpha-methylacyl-CoA racemase
MSAPTEVGGPLSGVRIVEMASLAPGPYAAMMLADMGADVLRVDRPVPMESNAGIVVNLLDRNRSSVAIDVKSQRGREALLRVIGQADGLIESYRPGVMERLGLGPEPCLEQNHRLVYGRVTGWGREGPLANAAGHDLNYLALTGALHSMGEAGAPPPVPLNLLGDFAGGGMLLGFGMVCALFEARSSGRGQVVDTAMVDGVSSLMTYIHGFRAGGNWSDERGTNILDGSAPYYRTYETKDQRYVAVAAVEKKFYRELIERLGLDLADLPPQNDRTRWPELTERLAEVFRSRTRSEWCELLEGTDACFAPVLDMGEAIEHPQNQAWGTFVDVEGVPQPAPAPRFGRTVPPKPKPARSAVDDSDEELLRWGFDTDDIGVLRSTGVVA